MKATRAQVERALDGPDPAIRLFLLYGPDEASSRALAARLAMGLGSDAERVDLAPSLLREDPARLADEAASIALFGGPRHILVEGGGDEIVPAVTALIEAHAAGNPAIIVAGALRKDSALVRLALAAPAALAFASYLPEGADADRMVMALGRETGLRMRGEVARRLVEASAGDRGVIAAEIAKLALYLDAAPERPGRARP